MKRILVPLDGSSRAEAALPVAALLVEPGGTLLLFCVVTPGRTYVPYVVTPPLYLNGTADESEYLERLSHRPEMEGIRVERLTTFGVAATAILEVAQSEAVDGIVLSSHGRTGLSRLVIGSVAESVARHARVPVLVLRPDRQGAVLPAPQGRPLRMLVPLDGSELAEEVIVPAANTLERLAGMAPAALRLVRVVQSIRGDTEDDDLVETDAATDLDVGLARNYLRDLVERLRAGPLAGRRIDITTVIAVDPDVAAALVRAAEGVDERGDSRGIPPCDLIAMATHGRSGLMRLALGSVTERVLHATRLPLLVVRPEDVTPAALHTAEVAATPELSGR